MTRRDDVIKAIKGIIEIIEKNIDDGLDESVLRNSVHGEWANVYQKRREEVERLQAEADDAHCRAYFTNLIESGKTKTIYQKRLGSYFVDGTLVKYLGDKMVLIRSEKGGLVKRHVERTCEPGLTLEQWLDYNRTHISIELHYVISRAYKQSKIPKTWLKYA